MFSQLTDNALMAVTGVAGIATTGFVVVAQSLNFENWTQVAFVTAYAIYVTAVALPAIHKRFDEYRDKKEEEIKVLNERIADLSKRVGRTEGNGK